METIRTAQITPIAISLLAAAVVHAGDARYQTSDVLDVSGAEMGYQGAAWLIRTEDGVSGRVMTRVSTAGDPYTLWVVVINNPEACVDGCDESDLGNPDVGASVFSGTGAISAPNGLLQENGKPTGGGVVNFDFSVPAHPLPSDLFLLFGDPDGLHVDNGYGAEIHLVIDKHPPVDPGISWIPDLTSTNFPGGGPATNDAVAVFLACPDINCPGSVL